MAGTTTLIGSGNHGYVVGRGDTDTVAIFGQGSDTINADAGTAKVYAASGGAGPFGFFGGVTGSATIKGGTLDISTRHGVLGETALGGSAVLAAGYGPAELEGGPGETTLLGGAGPDTFIGGGGTELMVGTHSLFSADVFDVKLPGRYVIDDFTGADKLTVDGYTLQQLEKGAGGARITELPHGGGTVITLGNGSGATTVTLTGVTLEPGKGGHGGGHKF